MNWTCLTWTTIVRWGTVTEDLHGWVATDSVLGTYSRVGDTINLCTKNMTPQYICDKLVLNRPNGISLLI